MGHGEGALEVDDVRQQHRQPGHVVGIQHEFVVADPAPEDLAQDIRNIARFSKGPAFILGDIRQPGEEYADRFLRAIQGYQGPVIVQFATSGRSRASCSARRR